MGALEASNTSGTYPTVIPVRPNYRGKVCISPCNLHAYSGPCPEAQIKKQYYSPCLESIPAKVIALALKDALLACEKDYPVPKICPLCQYSGTFSLFEVINQHRMFECPSCGLQFPDPVKALNYEKAYKGDYEGDLLEFTTLPYESYLNLEEEEKERKKWERLPRFNVLL
ncbi:MAG: methyltransferase type 12, partial [Caldimicrobium sp.]